MRFPFFLRKKVPFLGVIDTPLIFLIWRLIDSFVLSMEFKSHFMSQALNSFHNTAFETDVVVGRVDVGVGAVVVAPAQIGNKADRDKCRKIIRKTSKMD